LSTSSAFVIHAFLLQEGAIAQCLTLGKRSSYGTVRSSQGVVKSLLIVCDLYQNVP
jgi:hypothetical protein